jgi:hypothetical protein
MKNKNQQIQALLSSLDALLNVKIKLADRVGADEITISTTRARELAMEIRYCREQIKRTQPATTHFSRLDSIFSIK